MAEKQGFISSMTPYQFGIILLCTLINMLDGYDLFVMGFALPSMPSDWATPVQKGYLISAALLGMGIGAVVLARFADHKGRRNALIGGLVLNAVSLYVSALAPNYAVLVGARFFTGMAVGVVSVVGVMAAQEFAPPSRRSMAVGLVMFGYPMGSFVAGLVGAILIALGGWKGLFWVGAFLCTLALVLTLLFLPETPPYLRRAKDEKSRQMADKVASRFNLDTPVVGESAEPVAPIEHAKVYLLGKRYWKVTILLWIGYVLLSAAFYFISSWTPQLITNASGDKSVGALAGIMISIGTMLGALVYGYVGVRRSSSAISSVCMLIAMCALVGFALILLGPIALGLAVVLAACTYCAITSYVGMAGTVYPVLARAKGYGAMVGVGRVGAIVSPILGGYAVSVMSPRTMYLSILVPLGLALICSFILGRVGAPADADELHPARTS